jgi:CBS domain-containing protein
MTGWAESHFGDHRDGFESLHIGLTVELIATPRHDLKVCSADDRISEVIKENIENYDYLPVVRSEDDQKITGLFHTKRRAGGAPGGTTVARCQG